MRIKRVLNLACALVVTIQMFLSFAAGAIPESDTKSPCGCSLINKSIPSTAYISLVKSSSDKKRVLLRLVNNTDCAIEVEADGGGIIAYLTTSAAILGNIAKGQDGEVLSVDYYIQDIKFNKSPRMYYERGDNISIARIEPRLSITFSIPSSTFKKNNIMVPVKIVVGEITFRQEVYFFASELSLRDQPK